MITKVWKAVDPINGEWLSINETIRLRYELGKVTKPSVGSLFAFKTENAARSAFVHDWWTILECDAEVSPQQLDFSIALEPDYSLNLIETFWEDPHNFDKWEVCDNYRETILCDWIKPIEEL